MDKELKKEISSVKDWLILNSAGVPYIIGVGVRQWTEGLYSRYPNNLPMNFCGVRFTKNGSEIQFLADRKKYFDSFEKLINKRDKLDSIYKDFLRDEKDFLNTIKKIEKEGTEYLYNNFDQFIKSYDSEYISGFVVDGVLVYGEDFFVEMENKYPKHKEELKILVEPHGVTFLGEYRKKLLELIKEIDKDGYKTTTDLLNDTKIEKKIKEVQIQFHWIKNNYKNTIPLTVEFFAQEVLDRLTVEKKVDEELNEIENYVKNNEDSCDEIKSLSIFSEEDYEKLWWLGQIAWWVDRRKKYNLMANYYIDQYLKHVCSVNDVNYNDATFLLPNELEQVIKKEKKIQDFNIEERKNESIYFHNIHGENMFVVNEKAKEFWRNISPDISQDKDVKGMVAQKGTVRGTARIIMDAHNPGEFNDGDVLVTGMTRPDFLSLMKKAAAFVTDEGGITCHAAIVARELKRPCIIGTKIATKVLKDGDMVEVDADNGTVRIIG